MNLRALARLQKRQRKKAEREAEVAHDPAALPEHLAEQQRRIDAGLGYPPLDSNWPGVRDGWARR